MIITGKETLIPIATIFTLWIPLFFFSTFSPQNHVNWGLFALAYLGFPVKELFFSQMT